MEIERVTLRNIYFPIIFIIISLFFTSGFMNTIGYSESGCAKNYYYLFGTEIEGWAYWLLAFSIWFVVYGLLNILVFFYGGQEKKK